MGMFVNPNAAAFQCAVNSEVYIDKTGLLEYTNKVLGTNARFICNSRPRRFGKSVTVDMLTFILMYNGAVYQQVPVRI